MSDVEFGVCDICKKEKILQRAYYRYNIKCECHSPKHVEIVYHCIDCVPVEPKETNIQLKIEYLKSLSNAITITERKEKINQINETKRI